MCVCGRKDVVSLALREDWKQLALLFKAQKYMIFMLGLDSFPNENVNLWLLLESGAGTTSRSVGEMASKLKSSRGQKSASGFSFTLQEKSKNFSK